LERSIYCKERGKSGKIFYMAVEISPRHRRRHLMPEGEETKTIGDSS
jgi:hypothetical protein